jgi:hypothetical protein
VELLSGVRRFHGELSWMSASPRLGPVADEVVDGCYTIERQLGQGGTGAVLLARHNSTGGAPR